MFAVMFRCKFIGLVFDMLVSQCLSHYTLVQSSSLSYMGKTADTIANFSDKLTLIGAIVSTGIGLTVLTPLGRIISTQKLAWVYISPVSVLAIMTAILVGMYNNAFPPMSGGAFYFSYFFMGPILSPLFMTYGPLFLSNAEYLTTKYNEFQMQLSLVSQISQMTCLFSPHTHNTHTLREYSLEHIL